MTFSRGILVIIKSKNMGYHSNNLKNRSGLNNMKIPDDYVTEVSTAMIEGRAAFMAGAGISLNRNSWLPDWESLIYSLLKIVAGSQRDFEIEYIRKKYMKLLFNEVFLNLMSEVLGSEHVMDAIRKCMDIAEYNRIHKFLAWSMLCARSLVVTTNYDELIERASGLKAEPIKLHGTLGIPESMRFTVNHIFSPLNPEVANSTAAKLKGRTLLVLGYRGADDFDVIPFLFDRANLNKFIWITHGEPDNDLDPHTRKRLDERGDPYFRTNADDFLKAVYDKTKRHLGGDEELDKWNQWELNHSARTHDWWKRELIFWGEHIKKASPEDVDFLWAKILDYLRMYKLNWGGDEQRPAEEAYERFLRTNPRTIRGLEASLQLAYIKRITRTDESDVTKKKLIEDFNNIINTILSKSNSSNITDDERRKLQRLLARSYHELGVALQNQGLYSEANSYLQKAISLRRLSKEPEVAYSIFLQFMNAVRAYRVKEIRTIDEFIPGWDRTLLFELLQNAFLFREVSEPEHYSTTLHNLAYVHQFLAAEKENDGLFDDANREYRRAIKMYERAKSIREQLHDPRRIAQSNVRIAECKLGLAEHALKRHAFKTVCGFAEEASRLAKEVDIHYEEIPQESFRKEDLDNIRKNIEHLRYDAHCT